MALQVPTLSEAVARIQANPLIPVGIGVAIWQTKGNVRWIAAAIGLLWIMQDPGDLPPDELTPNQRRKVDRVEDGSVKLVQSFTMPGYGEPSRAIMNAGSQSNAPAESSAASADGDSVNGGQVRTSTGRLTARGGTMAGFTGPSANFN